MALILGENRSGAGPWGGPVEESPVSGWVANPEDSDPDVVVDHAVVSGEEIPSDNNREGAGSKNEKVAGEAQPIGGEGKVKDPEWSNCSGASY